MRDHSLSCCTDPSIDAQTEEPLEDIQYNWDMRLRPTSGGPEVQGSLGPYVQEMTENPDGELVIRTSSEAPAEGSIAKFRCLIRNGSITYTSPFYQIVSQTTDDQEAVTGGCINHVTQML